MRKRYYVALILAAFAVSQVGPGARPANAQAGVPTADAGVLAATLEQVQNGMQQLKTLQSQLQTAMSLVNAVKGGRGMDAIAGLLNQAGIRDMFPTELVDLMQGTADVVASAKSIRDGMTITSYPGNDFYLTELTARGERLSRDMATAQSLFSKLSKRSQGLDELRTRLASVTDPAEVDQLNARIAYETTQATNDLTKLQVLSMQQTTMERVEQQRAGEAAAKAAQAGYDYLTKGTVPAPGGGSGGSGGGGGGGSDGGSGGGAGGCGAPPRPDHWWRN